MMLLELYWKAKSVEKRCERDEILEVEEQVEEALLLYLQVSFSLYLVPVEA